MLKGFKLSHLPHWVITDVHPAFYDTESATAVQQTAKLYGKMQELITIYNEFVQQVNIYIDQFEKGIIKDFDCFKNCVVDTMDKYIQSIDQKIELQNSTIATEFQNQNDEIQNAVDYMKNNLVYTVNSLFTQAILDGSIKANLHIEYDETNESLDFSINAEGVEE